LNASSEGHLATSVVNSVHLRLSKNEIAKKFVSTPVPF